jgi:hypothetical protein
MMTIGHFLVVLWCDFGGGVPVYGGADEREFCPLATSL